LNSSFIREIGRIAQENYVPTPSDARNAKDKKTGVCEIDFSTGLRSVNLINVSALRHGDLNKWIHHFDDIMSIIHVVDLGRYGVVDFGQSDSSLREDLKSFKKLVTSGWFSNSSVVLLLANKDTFRQKLRRSPLSFYFPDYTGEGDIDGALKFVIEKFRSANEAHLSMFLVFGEADSFVIKQIFGALNDTIIKAYIT
jgi:guanine nucleotide-binding protein G(i) subunit alpha